MKEENKTKKQKKITIVVGGMHGLGRNTARLFKKLGYYIVVIDKQELPDDGDTSFYDMSIGVDLTSDESVNNAINKIKNSFSCICNLIFSARYRGPDDAKANWHGEIAIGLLSVDKFVSELTPLLEEQEVSKDASIIIISSGASQSIARDCSLPYHTVKAGMEQMVRYYAVNLGPKKIRVNGVSPVYLVKDESLKYFYKNKEKVKEVEELHPLKRFGRADDITSVIKFLCSEDASFITGQTITVDGGLTLKLLGF